MNTTTQYSPSTTSNKAAFALLAAAVVASFALSMRASEQHSVAQAKAPASATALEVRTLDRIVVTAQRDIRRTAAVVVVGHRNMPAAVAESGGTRSTNTMMSARFAY